MTPDAALQLAIARKHLGYARIIAATGLHDIAAREGCMPAFHGAEAFVVARTGRITNTHAGLRTVFTRLIHDLGGLSAEYPAFLAGAYELKAATDYGTGDIKITEEIAASVIRQAERLIEDVAALLGE